MSKSLKSDVVVVNLKDLSASEIVNYIRKEFGETIPVSLKSKKNVISHAVRIMGENGVSVFDGTNVKISIRDCPTRLIRGNVKVSKMTASQIVSKVHDCLGITLNYSLKSKKSIIKAAEELFMFSGYIVS